jgi:hypothetical protein
MGLDLQFIWKRFAISNAKKLAVAFLALLAGLAAAPFAAPVLKLLGISVVVLDVVTNGNPDKMTQINILHSVFAAGVGAFAVVGLDAARQLLSKHPRSPLPENVKKTIG